MGKCEFAERRKDNLYRCTVEAKQTVNLGDETLYLCPQHASMVMQLLAKKERLEKNYAQVSQEINTAKQKILDAHQELIRRERQKTESSSL